MVLQPCAVANGRSTFDPPDLILHMSSNASPLEALISESWVQLAEGPRFYETAARLEREANGAARGLAYAELWRSFGKLAAGDHVEFGSHLKHAQELFNICADQGGLAACLELLAKQAMLKGDLTAAGKILAPALRMVEQGLDDFVSVAVLLRNGSLSERLGSFEDALRTNYRAVRAARRTDSPLVLSEALSCLAGMHIGVMNFHDALPLCEEAWALSQGQESRWQSAFTGPNLALALSGSSLHARACDLIAQLMGLDGKFIPRQRAMRFYSYAAVYALAGRYHEAQGCLDVGTLAHIAGYTPETDAVCAKVMILNEAQRWSDSLTIVREYLARGGSPLRKLDYPRDQEILHSQAARACEALGDLRGALEYERNASKARSEAHRQASDARRLSLQIEFELDAAHSRRDAAIQEQARLAELNHALSQANLAKTRFLAAASHDLRQPVQALTMYMSALGREPSAQSRRDLLARMNASLKALGSMFDVLLDVSRLDAGAVPVEVAIVPLDELVRRLVDEYSLPATQRRLQLRLHLAPGAAAAATTSDAVLLEGVLRNLLDNALKYTAEGGVVMRVRPWHGGLKWRIEVRDTGPGIAPEHHELVFQEFFQVGNEERDRAKGLGLGLSIVRRTAALLGHPLGLRSRPGRGSCFHIDVPCTGPIAQVDAALTEVNMSVALRLALIDDDAAVRDSLATVLQGWGHRVLQGADSDAVVQQWQALGQPHMAGAIVDMRLRGQRTGLQAIAALREQMNAALPALVITGDIAPDRLRTLAQAGQPCLHKPVMPMRLRSWLQGLAPH